MSEEMKQPSDSESNLCEPGCSNDDPHRIENDSSLNCTNDPGQKRERDDAVTNDSDTLEGKRKKLNTCYSLRKAINAAKNMRSESTFNEALSTLKSWLESGECTKQNAGNFCSLIQSEEMKQPSDSKSNLCEPGCSNDDPHRIENDSIFICTNDPSQKRERDDAVTNDSDTLEGKHKKLNTCFSLHEAKNVTKNMRSESTFNEALSTLKSWLESGECTKENAGNFYSLIQSAAAHFNRVNQKVENDKKIISKMEWDLMRFKKDSLVQTDTIKAVFNSAEEQKVHFTKADRDGIEKSKIDIDTYHEKLTQDLASYGSCSISEDSETVKRQEIKKLLEENKKLSSRLAAIEKEEETLQSRLAAVKAVNEILEEVGKSIRGVRDGIEESKSDIDTHHEKITEELASYGSCSISQDCETAKHQEIKKLHEENKNLSSRLAAIEKELLQSRLAADKGVNKILEEVGKSIRGLTFYNSKDQIQLIYLIFTFLHTHSLDGVSTACILSYLKDLKELGSDMDEQDIDTFLTAFPSIFKKVVSGKETKWTFYGKK